MKKILFLLSVLSLFISVVNAEESVWQEEFLEGENVEVEYRYRFYTETKIGNYLKKGQVSGYEYEDTTKVMHGSYSNYKTVCEEDPDKYLIIKDKKYEYQEILPIQYVKIINTSEEQLVIKNISIYNLKTKLNHKVYSYYNATEDGIYIEKNGYVVFGMPMSVTLRQFSLVLELENKEIDYELLFSNSKTFNDDKLVARTIGNSNKTLYKYDETFDLYNNYSNTYIGYNITIDDLIKVLSVQDVCRTRLILTYHYNIEKEYYDENYYASIDDIEFKDEEEKNLYQKDTNDYKIFYRYNNLELNINKDSYLEESNNQDDLTINTLITNNTKEEVNDSDLEAEEDKDVVDNDTDIKLVKTGIESNPLNYKYLIIYVLILLLVALILIKHLKNNVE